MKLLQALLVAGALVASACATEPVGDIAPGERPDITTDEAGLWMRADKAESALSTWGNLVRDPALNTYVRDIACTLAGPRCGDIRVYIQRVPAFNAMMFPNGMMVIWTGLLLRCHNEAQLAAVIGHEIAHFIKRDSVERWRNTRATTAMLSILQVATGGEALINSVATLAAMASLSAYSRDDEREADAIGVQLIAEAGYDANEVADIWRHLVRENEAAEDEDSGLFFLRTHPTSRERMATLEILAKQMVAHTQLAKTGRDRYLEITLPHRAEYLRDDLALRQFSRSAELIRILEEQNAAPGELKYFEGELYRQRGGNADLEKAISAYAQAATLEDAPPEVHLALGLSYIEHGDADMGHRELRRYLELRPDAVDRHMIGEILKSDET